MIFYYFRRPNFFVNYFLGLFHGFIGQNSQRVTANRMKQRERGRHAAAGRSQTFGCCSEDTASVHGAHALPNELQGAPCSPTF